MPPKQSNPETIQELLFYNTGINAMTTLFSYLHLKKKMFDA